MWTLCIEHQRQQQLQQQHNHREMNLFRYLNYFSLSLRPSLVLSSQFMYDFGISDIIIII